jgi:hypothetical protein
MGRHRRHIALCRHYVNEFGTDANAPGEPGRNQGETIHMSLITSAEHAYAVAIGDIKKGGTVLTGTVLPILQRLHADAPSIEAVSAAVSPNLVNIERAGDAALGKIIQLITDGDTAAVNGLTAALGVQIVNDVKAIAPAVKAQAQATGLLAAVTPAA